MASTIRQGITVEIDGLREMQAVLRRMPKTAQAEARTQSQKIADTETTRIQRAARTRQGRLAARSVRSRRDRVPTVAAGGARTVRPGVRGGDVFFGAEFGGRGRPSTRQFPPHRGRRGYFMWPTLRADTDRMFKQWSKAVDKIADEWAD